MRLYLLEVEGYKSFKNKTALRCDQKVTAILGANDHGKSNLLSALSYLNDKPDIDKSGIVHWDYDKKSDKYPILTYHFDLDSEEQTEIRKIASKRLQLNAASEYHLESQATYNAEGEALSTERANNVSLRDKKNSISAEKVATEAALTADSENAEIKLKLNSIGETSVETERDLDVSDKLILKLEKSTEKAKAKYLTAATNMFVSKMKHEDKYSSCGDIGKVLDAINSAHNKIIKSHEESVAEVAIAQSKLEELQKLDDQDAIKNAKDDLDAKQHTSDRLDDEIIDNEYLIEAVVDVKHYIASDNYKNFRRPPLRVDKIPNNTIKFSIQLVGANFERRFIFSNDSFDNEVVREYLARYIPSIEIIKPIDHLPDSIFKDNCNDEDMAFMRGILYYAGLTQKDLETIFERNDQTHPKLRKAQELFNTAIKKSWSQGRELEFHLFHGPEQKQISFRINEPSVDSDVCVSKRSSGFSQFFGIKTIQYAKEIESQANSYIWIFDEPGLHLHPSGQRDLLQVFESLSSTNQVIYSTHSIFLINNNFPTRHRLVEKTNAGSRVETKPYTGQWNKAIESLGLRLPGTILFGTKVLLVEGITDTIFLSALLQFLIKNGKIKADINPLSIIDIGDEKHADSLIRMLSNSHIKPQICALLDGDDGGEAKRANLAEVMADHEIKCFVLSKDKEVEDFMPYVKEIHIPALAAYICEFHHDKKIEDLIVSLENSHTKSDKTISDDGLLKWICAEYKKITGSDKFSKTDFARHYSDKLLDSDIKMDVPVETMKVLDSIVKTLKLEPLTAKQKQITSS